MKLYDFWRSTAAYRVRIALNLKGLEVESQDIDLFEDAQHEAAFKAINPQGMVPALVLDEGTVLTQALAIIEYLDELYPEPRLLPIDPVERAKVRAVALAIAADIHPIQSMSVSKRVDTLVPGHFAQWIKDTIELRLPSVEVLLKDTDGPYCFGDQISLADLCLIPQLYNAKAAGIDLGAYPRLQAIDAACLALPAFADAAPQEPKSR